MILICKSNLLPQCYFAPHVNTVHFLFSSFSLFSVTCCVSVYNYLTCHHLSPWTNKLIWIELIWIEFQLISPSNRLWIPVKSCKTPFSGHVLQLHLWVCKYHRSVRRWWWYEFSRSVSWFSRKCLHSDDPAEESWEKWIDASWLKSEKKWHKICNTFTKESHTYLFLCYTQ